VTTSSRDYFEEVSKTWDDIHPVDPTGGESHLKLAKIRCLSACLSQMRRERVGELSFAVSEREVLGQRLDQADEDVFGLTPALPAS
jgi:hypothetical protein